MIDSAVPSPRRSRPRRLRIAAVTAAVAAALTPGLGLTGAADAHAAPSSVAVSAGPSAPTGTDVTYELDSFTATITWSGNARKNVAGYRVFRRPAGEGAPPAEVISGDAPLTATSFTDHPPADGATYAYWVRAVDRAGHESSDSAAVYVSTADATAPEAPTSLTAQGTTAGNTLRWTAPPGDWDHFEISSDPDTRPYPDEGATTTSFTAHTDLSAPTGVSVSYRVRAVDAAGNASAYSETVTVTRPEPVGPTPALVESQVIDGAAHLWWDVNSEMTNYYHVYRRSPGEQAWNLVGTPYASSGSWVDPQPLFGYTNYYIVNVDDAGRESAPARTSVQP
ncbi:hypothetical protein [Streptomyces aureus]|uniref:Fibronectin type-III domain-containing protein n=1 Tax=Streptomyces aureus TaxID=193461 RepID=A0ABV4SWV1_9ACTN